MSALKDVERVLLSFLRDPPGGERREQIQRFLDPSALAMLTQAAEAHGILGYAYASLRALPSLDGMLLEDLRARYRTALRRHLAAIADLTRLSEVLQELEGQWLVLDGPVLPETVHPRADLRSYDTMDLLVEENVLPRFLDLVGEAGSRRLQRPRDDPSGESAKVVVHFLLRHDTFTR
ncbi:MAG: nucleotidyltransferase family protein, partial [Candidatus Methylomirabilales bacterium]